MHGRMRALRRYVSEAVVPPNEEAYQMRSKRQEGRGRLVPTQATGIAYPVQYGIPVGGSLQHGRRLRPMHWSKCSVHLPQGGLCPDGHYFLYTDEGKVHQLKSIEGKWLCFTIVA